MLSALPSVCLLVASFFKSSISSSFESKEPVLTISNIDSTLGTQSSGTSITLKIVSEEKQTLEETIIIKK